MKFEIVLYLIVAYLIAGIIAFIIASIVDKSSKFYDDGWFATDYSFVVFIWPFFIVATLFDFIINSITKIARNMNKE
jgi:hypothetical protein